MYGFHVVHNTIYLIERQCCDEIMDMYSAKVMQYPSINDQRKKVAAELSSGWNFHHTLEAIDGNHVAILSPR